MFQRQMRQDYQQMMADLEANVYVSKFYRVFDGETYKGMAASEDNALSMAVQYDNPAIYYVDNDAQESHRVY